VLERTGPAKPIKRDYPSLSEIMIRTLSAGASYRTYGANMEFRRPIFHRFPKSKLRCEGSVQNLMVDSITRSNILLRSLSRKGR
jgi:hypothetical protein